MCLLHHRLQSLMLPVKPKMLILSEKSTLFENVNTCYKLSSFSCKCIQGVSTCVHQILLIHLLSNLTIIE